MSGLDTLASAAGDATILAVAVRGRRLGSAPGYLRCAFLQAFMTSPDHEHRSWARHLLHVHIVSELAKAGVRHFVSENALRPAPGIQYFQHLVGLKAANVRIRHYEP